MKTLNFAFEINWPLIPSYLSILSLVNYIPIYQIAIYRKFHEKYVRLWEDRKIRS